MNENEVSTVDSVKKCPICGGVLERGYAIVYRGCDGTQKNILFVEGKSYCQNTPHGQTRTSCIAMLEMPHHNIRLRKEGIGHE
jgi:hypothetical protein